MMNIAKRLAEARIAAGFATAQEAVNRFGWVYATYASHENGHRGIRKETLAEYARAFKVDLAWLLDGRQPDNVTITPIGVGMAEPEMAPFVARNHSQDQQIYQMVRLLCPGVKHYQLWRARRSYMGYAVRRGDLLIVGTPPEPQRGAIVLATLVDEQTSHSETVLRQSYEPLLVALPGDELQGESSMSTAVLGTVLAIIRAPEGLQP